MDISKLCSSTFLSSISAGVLLLAAAPALANPMDGQVVAGSASISESGKKLDVTQNSQKVIIDWRGFDIAPDEHTQFHQPSSSAVALNRINDTKVSQIDGRLTANGNIILVNPNGVFIGQGANIDVAGITVTTADVSNDDFMNHATPHFATPGQSDAAIINEGMITAREAGLVGLVAPRVENRGTITALLGKVQLASGDTFTLDLAGDGITNIAVSDAVQEQLVSNEGIISANGGVVTLTAAAARDMVDSLITNTGYIEAKTIGSKAGKIVLYAEGSNAVIGNDSSKKKIKSGRSTVTNSGTLDVSGLGDGEQGGYIEVLADNVGILSGAYLTATGSAGGGNILIGGDYLGTGDTPAALSNIIQNNVFIEANSLVSGDGGRVIVWSDDYTDYAGQTEVKALGETGNGGFVETSGKFILNVSGNASASSRRGRKGMWLLDPADVTISTGSDNNITGNPNFTPTAASAVINVSTIVTALDNGTDVTVTTGGDAHAGSGNITVANAISATIGTANATGGLTLSASGNIIVNAAITLGGGAVTGGDVLLRARNADAASGYVDISAAITTNGGDITIGGGSGTISAGSGFAIGDNSTFNRIGVNIDGGAAINAGGGNIIINGTGGTRSSSNYGILVNMSNTSVYTSGSGTVTLTGIGGTVSDSTNYGVYIANGAKTYTASGTLTLNGTAGTGATVSIFSSGGANEIGASAQTGNIILNSTGSISMNEMAIETGGSGSVTLSSSSHIDLDDAENSITTAGGDVLLRTRNANGATGYVDVSADITTNGGDITIGGGSGTISAGSGFAIGDNSTFNRIGVNIDGGAAINAGGGNIIINGTGGTRSSSNYGILVNMSNTSVYTSGSGTVTLTGIGGTVSDSTNYGVYIANGSKTYTGSGLLTINGTAGLGTTLGIYSVTGSNEIGASAQTGNIVLNTDVISLNNMAIETTGTVTFAPLTNGTAINVVTGSGGLEITSTLLGLISSASEVIIGRSDNTALLTAGARTWSRSARFITGSGGITVSGAQTMGANNLTLQTDGTLTVSANLSGTGTLSVFPASASSTIGVNASSGSTLNINSTALGYIQSGWGGLVFGSNSGTGAMSINAHTWNAPVTFLNGTGNITFDSTGTHNFGSNALTVTTSNGGVSGGNITLETITAGSVIARTIGGSAANITLEGQITASANSSNAVILDSGTSGGNIVNNYGASALNLTGTDSRWILYSSHSADDTSGGLSADQTITNATYATLSPSSIIAPTYDATQNTWVYGTSNGTITITANALTMTYGDTFAGFTYGFVCSDSCSSGVMTGSLSTNATSSTGGHYNAGTWSITQGTLSASNGYAITYTGNTFTVNTRTITVNGITASNKTYDAATTATLNTGSASLATILTGDVVSLNTGSAVGTFDNANVGSSKTVTISGLALAGADAANYTFSNPTTTADITQLAITVTNVTANNKIYDGVNTATLDTGSAALSGVLGADTGNVTLNSGSASGTFSNVNVGTGRTVNTSGFSIGGSASSNYTLTQPTATANITARDLTITADNQNKAYGNTFTFDGDEFSSSGLQNGETIGSVSLTSAGAASGATVAGGPYAITPSAATGGTFTASNYNISYVNGSLTVTPYSLTVSVASASNKEYDGDADATVTLSDNRVSGDTLTVNYTSSSFADKNVGTSKLVTVGGISIGGADSANYTLASTTATSNANITAKSLTASLTGSASKTYDGTTSATLASNNYSLAGTVSGDTVTVSNTAGTYDNENVGTGKTVTITSLSLAGADAGNYTLTNAASVDGTIGAITQRTLTLSGFAAANKVYDGNDTAAITSNGTLANTVSGDDISLDPASRAATFSNANVGTAKTVTATGYALSGADAANYTLTQPTDTADITAASLTITANGQTITYGDGNSYNGYSTSGLVGGDSVTNVSYATNATLSTSGNWEQGSWNITPSAATGSGLSNYTITYNNGALTVNAKSLSISGFAAANKTYDRTTTATITNNGTLSGTVGIDVVTLDTGSASASFADFNVASGKTVNASGYGLSGTDASNYTLTQPTATADITAASLTITANGKTMTYGDGNSYNGFSTAGLISGDSVSGVNYATNATLSTSGNWEQGTWSITPSAAAGSGLSNYTITYNAGALTVSRLAAALTGFAVADKVYDRTTAATITNNGTLTSIVNTDVVTLNAGSASASFADFNVADGKAVNASSYALSGTDAGNYTLTQPGTTADITPKALTLSGFAVANKVYDRTTAATITNNGTLTGIIGVDAVTLDTGSALASFADYNVASGKTVNVSGYGLSGANAGNYTLTQPGATANITVRTLLINADAASKTYGAADPSFTYTQTGLISGDSITGALARAAGETVAGAPYTITQGSLDAGSNYTISYTGAQFNINKALLTVTANNSQRDYGTANPSFSASYSGFVLGDALGVLSGSPLLTTLADSNSSAGTYAINAALGTLSAANYTFTFANGVLTINEAASTNNNASSAVTPTIRRKMETPLVGMSESLSTIPRFSFGDSSEGNFIAPPELINNIDNAIPANLDTFFAPPPTGIAEEI